MVSVVPGAEHESEGGHRGQILAEEDGVALPAAVRGLPPASTLNQDCLPFPVVCYSMGPLVTPSYVLLVIPSGARQLRKPTK